MAFACGPLTKPRYINQKIEKELVEFKEEVEAKFNKSDMRLYYFPKKKEGKDLRMGQSKIIEIEDDYCLEDVLKMEELTLPKVNYDPLDHAKLTKKYVENVNLN